MPDLTGMSNSISMISKRIPTSYGTLIGLQSHDSVTAVMRERLIRRMLAAGEEAPTIEPAPTQRSGQRSVSEAEAKS